MERLQQRADKKTHSISQISNITVEYNETLYYALANSFTSWQAVLPYMFKVQTSTRQAWKQKRIKLTTESVNSTDRKQKLLEWKSNNLEGTVKSGKEAAFALAALEHKLW